MKRRTMNTALLGVLLSASMMPLAAAEQQNSPQAPLVTADWSGTDDLRRSLPTFAETGPTKPNHWVGLFYWQWHVIDRWGPDYDMTKFLASHPRFMDFTAYPPDGPNNPTWYWAEPLFGYYRSTDPWVIRKHLALFADAGVDFLYLDDTNDSIYDEQMKTFLAVAEDMKSKGVRVPKLVFFLNYEPDWKVESLYKEWYKPGKHDDMWFMWKGKPLIMTAMPTDGAKMKDPSLLPEIQSYFTFRKTWAFADPVKAPSQWQFIDGNPTHAAIGPDGKTEQAVVSKSMGGPIWGNMQTGSASATPGHVPVYDDQWVSPDAGKGLFFQYQFDEAVKENAPILLITGWNEWTASVWETPGVVMLGRKTVKGQGHIVDEFNRDFNRDLEPMAGGYNDNYFCQFFADLRRYKGMEAPQPVSAPKRMRVDGSFAKWAGVTPLYHDVAGDTANRDWPSATPGARYYNQSARNDIVTAQVARDSDNIYFHVQTAAALTPPAGRQWMTLFVDADGDPKTGWHGYDYLIDRSRSGRACSVEINVGGVWNWKKIADAPIRWSGRDLEISVSRTAFGCEGKPIKLDFKWADNLPETPQLMDFYSDGDVAPDARFNYHYEAK